MVGALLINAIAAHASGPYTAGASGYDVSWPQCTSGFTVPPGSSFGIIGVNNGRPFSTNPCFATNPTEYSGVANSVYINTGYAKTYASRITSGCSTGRSTAWDIGCSEAETSLGYVGGASISMWWLDVETANSWNSGNLQPNRDTIQGALDRLQSTGPVGVYSTASAWSRITGRTNFVPVGVAGVWVPAPQCQGAASFITGKQVWLTQQATPSIDLDTAC